MKNLELQNYGVSTMTAREMRTTNGGDWVNGLLLSFLYDVVTDWEANVAAFRDGYSQKNRC